MKYSSLFLLLFFISGCSSDEVLVPKPPTYLRLELPMHSYKLFNEKCPYTFQVSKLFNIKAVKDNAGETCHKDIDLGKLNGIMHFSYIEMNEPLATYVNYSNDKVEDHKLKATGIDDVQIIRPNDKVYGTFFKLKGDVASPFQFYLTDSTSRFVSGVVYMNTVPNYDSMKPTLDYLELDLMKMVNTFKWK